MLAGRMRMAAAGVSVGISNWWEAGGATGAVRVYQPKGAASLAASYVDLTGNQDAAPGVAPTWDAVNGWQGNGSTVCLTTGLTPANDSYTYIVRFAETVITDNAVALGFLDSSKRTYLQPRTSGAVGYANSSAVVAVAPNLAAGVIAVNATDGYRDGTSETSAVGNWGAGTAQEIYLLALKRSASITNYFNGAIQAVAIYNNSLTGAQVAAVAAAMAAL